MKRVLLKADVASTLQLIAILIIGFLGRTTFGFKIEDNINLPGFNSLLDLQKHYLNTPIKAEGAIRNLSKWNKWPISVQPYDPSKHLSRRQLQHLPDSSQSEHVNVLNGKYVRHVISRYNGKGEKSKLSHSDIDNSVTGKDKPSPSVQFWSKRDTNSQTLPSSAADEKDIKTSQVKKFALMDEALEKLQPDNNCTKKIGLCAHNPLKNLDCILHCHLSTKALANPSTKFLFRLLNMYSDYYKMLCPTFGQIYDEIPTILKQHKQPNTLLGFLAGIGIVEEAPVNVDFIKNSPSSLINNLIKFGHGEDLEIMKLILNTAETAATVQLSETSQFPSLYGNARCKLAPKEGWFVSITDAMTKHPTLTDIFLRGYWLLTRALSVELPYPFDSLFASIAYSLKLLTGVDCSIIAYAEQGKPFKCRQPPPIDEIFNSYSESVKEDVADSTYSWMVCGAHQVGIPDWIQNKEGLDGRDVTNLKDYEQKSLGSLYQDLNTFPNPDEIMY